MWIALTTAVFRDIGCFGGLTRPLNNGVRAVYRRFGFEDLPSDPLVA